MKKYRDVFNKPITKDDVRMAAKVVVMTNNPYPTNLQRHMKIGYGKAARLNDLLTESGILSEPDGSKPRFVILKDETQAVNAALRQLRKGNS